MAIDNNTSVHSRVISAFFDTSDAAKKAVIDLVAAGIPRQHITESGGQAMTASTTGRTDDRSAWESLKDLFLPPEDRYTYEEGLRRGGYLVSVRADEANYDRVLEILDNDGSVNLDERESQWRSEGWTGFKADDETLTDARTSASTATTAAATASSAAMMGSSAATQTDYKADAAARDAALGRSAVSVPTSARASALESGRDEVIPLYEEQLRVGKRDVSHGRVRLRSYVVETPVNEQVSLRDEKVFVDRKAVDRPVSSSDALFQDRVIEVEEFGEEAVISKEARVREEITLRKTSEEHVQNVSDTVRRTEVEIDDGRTRQVTGGSKVSGFTAATDASRIVEHMEVISADGQKIGTVDHLDGPDRIKLAKNSSPDGQHHMVPFAWIDHVDQHVHLKKTLADIKAQQ